METRARYVLVGAFTLAVIAATFLFVYWLNVAGGLQQRAVYRIRYENSVAGLLVGSAVLFNGVRVGEVTRLELIPDAPRDVLVTIGVEPTTPVRKDTKAGIEFQGLTGSPAVSLKGGTSDLLGPDENGEPPTLTADPDAGQSMSDAAREALRRIDAILADNADPLRNTITNLSKFSDALGRNSNRVDGVMAWLERLSGGSKTQGVTYDLTAPHEFAAFEPPKELQLVLPEPTITFALSQDKILTREQGSLKPLIGEPRWSDMLANLFQTRVIQSFENAKFLGQISRPADGLTGGNQLAIDIRSFEVIASPDLAAVVEFSARVLSSEGRALGARAFRASVPIKTNDGAAAAAALDAAFGTTASELIVWTGTTIQETTP